MGAAPDPLGSGPKRPGAPRVKPPDLPGVRSFVREGSRDAEPRDDEAPAGVRSPGREGSRDREGGGAEFPQPPRPLDPAGGVRRSVRAAKQIGDIPDDIAVLFEGVEVFHKVIIVCGDFEKAANALWRWLAALTNALLWAPRRRFRRAIRRRLRDRLQHSRLRPPSWSSHGFECCVLATRRAQTDCILPRRRMPGAFFDYQLNDFIRGFLIASYL